MTQSLRERNWEKEFDNLFVPVDGHDDNPQTWGSVSNVKSFITKTLATERQQVLVEKQELLHDFADWLHKHGYIDADYYTEEPKAVDAYLLSKKQ